MKIRAADLIIQLGGELRGDPDVQFTRVGTLSDADSNCIAFLANPKYQSQLVACKAAVIIVSAPASSAVPATATAIVTQHPYLYYARVSQLLAPAKAFAGIDEAAHINPSARIGANVSIGPFVTIDAGAVIADDVYISSHCTIGRDVKIGKSSVLHPRVSIYADCQIGQRAIVHSGVVIGADGFGYAVQSSVQSVFQSPPQSPPDGTSNWLKIAQLGAVVIGDDVEIGANTTIDRGAIGNTMIGNGCKLDNQIQIAHNVVIGDHTAIAACVGIAGSTVIGAHCMIGGAAGVIGHLSICDKVTISAMTLVTKSIKEPGVYTGVFPLMKNREWERSAVLVKQLDDLRSRIKTIEAELAKQNEPAGSVQTKGS